jgi:hypothetical protein
LARGVVSGWGGTIQVKGDGKRESNEMLYRHRFGQSSNASFSKNRGLGSILNDD